MSFTYYWIFVDIHSDSSVKGALRAPETTDKYIIGDHGHSQVRDEKGLNQN